MWRRRNRKRHREAWLPVFQMAEAHPVVKSKTPAIGVNTPASINIVPAMALALNTALVNGGVSKLWWHRGVLAAQADGIGYFICHYSAGVTIRQKIPVKCQCHQQQRRNGTYGACETMMY